MEKESILIPNYRLGNEQKPTFVTYTKPQVFKKKESKFKIQDPKFEALIPSNGINFKSNTSFEAGVDLNSMFDVVS